MYETLTYSASIQIEADPEAVYAVVSDITRTGEWSPVCRECWWDEGHGPHAGAWFTGRNATADREWETRAQVVVANNGKAFGWSIGPGRAIWEYRMREIEHGTELTECWEFTTEGQKFFAEKYGEDAAAQISERTESAREGILTTLAALKRIIEAG